MLLKPHLRAGALCASCLARALWFFLSRLSALASRVSVFQRLSFIDAAPAASSCSCVCCVQNLCVRLVLIRHCTTRSASSATVVIVELRMFRTPLLVSCILGCLCCPSHCVLFRTGPPRLGEGYIAGELLVLHCRFVFFSSSLFLSRRVYRFACFLSCRSGSHP